MSEWADNIELRALLAEQESRQNRRDSAASLPRPEGYVDASECEAGYAPRRRRWVDGDVAEAEITALERALCEMGRRADRFERIARVERQAFWRMLAIAAALWCLAAWAWWPR